MKSPVPISLLLALLGCGMILPAGCKKDIQVQQKEIKYMDDLVIDSAFKWETTRQIRATIRAAFSGQAIGTFARIFVYQGDPAQGGRLISTGSVGYEYPFEATLRLPTALTALHLKMVTGSGYSNVVEVPVTDNLTYFFPEGGGKKLIPTGINDPDCLSGCDQILAGSGTSVIADGQTYCITSSYSGTITINHGTLKICGTFSGNVTMGQGDKVCNLILTSAADVSIPSLSMSRNCTMTVYGTAIAVIGTVVLNQNARLINYGTTTINANFSPNDLVRNFGNLIVNGQYTMNGINGELQNSGILTIYSHWDVFSTVINEGMIEVFGDIRFDESDVQNRCAITGHQHIYFNQVDYTSNNGYIHADLEAMVYGGATIILQNQSMISTPDFTMNNTVTGQGSANVIKCTSTGRINGNQFVSGPIEMLTPTGTLATGNYPDNFQNGATLASIANASAYIPTGACNPEGSGQPVLTDTDGDGVFDPLDDYPSDPGRAYDTWYPNASGFGTLVFEDLWPSRGDYDLNDAVIDYQFRVVTNAQNNVVDIKPKFYIRAAGATLRNGFGFQLDNVQPGNVGSVSGYNLKYGYISLGANGVENLQQHAVVMVWDNADNVIHRVGLSSFYNTLRNYPTGYSDTVLITLHFATPQPQSLVGTPPYNPFLIKNMDRNIEIHLPDYIPTSLANTAFFGTSDDDSDPAKGRYYKTDRNLPWGMNIAERYDYTYEMVPVLNGYNHFAAWCQSSGFQYPDWYRDLPGYRNPSNIYSLQVK